MNRCKTTPFGKAAAYIDTGANHNSWKKEAPGTSHSGWKKDEKTLV